MTTSIAKATFSLTGGIIMFITSNPSTYQLMNGFLNGEIVDVNNCSTEKGVIIHTLLFFIIVYSVMLLFNYLKDPMDKRGGLLKISINSTLLYFFINSQIMYHIVNRLTTCLGLFPTLENNCPTLTGTIIHSIIYTLSVYFMMLIE